MTCGHFIFRCVHEKEKAYKCKTCDKSWGTSSQLNKHMIIFHSNPDGPLTFPCDLCGKVISDPNNFARHMKVVHEGVRNHKCKQCPKTFGCRSHLEAHVQMTHEKTKNHTCDQCGKSFYQSSDVTKHIKQVHDKIKDFSCERCGNAYSQFSELKQHVSFVFQLANIFVQF